MTNDIYRLVDVGVSFKKIMHGRKWVGRVVKHATEPRYLGIIGKITVSMPTERGAFDEVVARQLGFTSCAALDAHNAEVRAKNRVIRAETRHVFDQMINHNNFEPMLDMLLSKEKHKGES
ncbi:MAG TPA: hypothetical protein VNG73_01160 [Gemmatimonadaceae bacterium]|nr:hypothetical protein [Gemmatimonadaceae bacterium]